MLLSVLSLLSYNLKKKDKKNSKNRAIVYKSCKQSLK